MISIGLPVAKDRLSRKLAVILHADVIGSTKLVQQNETLAHERIQDAFQRSCINITALAYFYKIQKKGTLKWTTAPVAT
jgi:class 3 adenylate cyclase